RPAAGASRPPGRAAGRGLHRVLADRLRGRRPPHRRRLRVRRGRGRRPPAGGVAGGGRVPDPPGPAPAGPRPPPRPAPAPSPRAVAGRWAWYWGLTLLVGAAATGLLVFGGRLPGRPALLLGSALAAAAAGPGALAGTRA